MVPQLPSCAPGDRISTTPDAVPFDERKTAQSYRPHPPLEQQTARSLGGAPRLFYLRDLTKYIWFEPSPRVLKAWTSLYLATYGSS